MVKGLIPAFSAFGTQQKIPTGFGVPFPIIVKFAEGIAVVMLDVTLILSPSGSPKSTLKQMLSSGHIIIEWVGKISDEQLAQLDEAAKLGNSHGLLIRRR